MNGNPAYENAGSGAPTAGTHSEGTFATKHSTGNTSQGSGGMELDTMADVEGEALVEDMEEEEDEDDDSVSSSPPLPFPFPPHLSVSYVCIRKILMKWIMPPYRTSKSSWRMLCRHERWTLGARPPLPQQRRDLSFLPEQHLPPPPLTPWVQFLSKDDVSFAPTSCTFRSND